MDTSCYRGSTHRRNRYRRHRWRTSRLPSILARDPPAGTNIRRTRNADSPCTSWGDSACGTNGHCRNRDRSWPEECSSRHSLHAAPSCDDHLPSFEHDSAARCSAPARHPALPIRAAAARRRPAAGCGAAAVGSDGPVAVAGTAGPAAAGPVAVAGCAGPAAARTAAPAVVGPVAVAPVVEPAAAVAVAVAEAVVGLAVVESVARGLSVRPAVAARVAPAAVAVAPEGAAVARVALPAGPYPAAFLACHSFHRSGLVARSRG